MIRRSPRSAQFTDATSQTQGELFTALSKEMTETNAKNFCATAHLEQAVRTIHQKCILDSRGQMEKRWKIAIAAKATGSPHYASLDPQDIAAVETVNINQNRQR